MSRATSAERKKTERFLPYPYERFGLDLALARVRVDGVDRTSSIQAEARLVPLEDRRPERVEIDLVAQIEQPVLERLLPAEELPAPALELFVAVRCPATRLSRRVSLAEDAARPRHFAGMLTLSIDDVRGLVELTPYLVRRVEGRSKVHARHAGARLASARPWILRFDLGRTTSGKFIDVRYEPFSKLSEAALWSSALYRLQCELDDPILWLNSDHRELVAILDSKATNNAAARMREVFFAHIAHNVWAQLFMYAAESCSPDGDGAHPWCAAVLQRFLPAIFPELGDHRSRVAELVERIRDGKSGELSQLLDRALQAEVNIVHQMKSLIEEKGE